MYGWVAKLQKVAMSASTLHRFLLAAGMIAVVGSAFAQEEELPDVDFLEYLGSWEESDEDWVIVERIDSVRRDVDEERSDPVPQGEESRENEHEG